MTPIWRMIAKKLTTVYSPTEMAATGIRSFMSVQRAFDFGPVSDLCEETSKSILQGGVDMGTGKSHGEFEVYDLGERCIMPADSFWIEFGRGGGNQTHYLGYVVEKNPGLAHWLPDDYFVWMLNRPGDALGFRCVSVIRKVDELFQLVLASDAEDAAEADDDLGMAALANSHILAALAILNSPKARVENGPPQKLAARALGKASRASPPVMWSKVVIDGLAHARTVSDDRRTASPKAYHFVRAHPRQLEDGRIVSVRAHWRGDPAFGIRISHYEVRTPRSRETVH